MPIKKILVPVQGAETDKQVLATAFSVAIEFGAQVQALFVRPDPSEALPYLGDGVSGQVIEELLQAAKEGADGASNAARAYLSAAAEAAGVPVSDSTSPLPSARFTDLTGRRDLVVAEESRLTDIVLFSEAAHGDEMSGGDALEAAMMSAGRPVLIAPTNQPASIGKSIMIGWDGSAEASHAVANAMPFISRAASVTVLSVGTSEDDSTDVTSLTDYLALHGANAGVRIVSSDGRAVGEVLLDEAEKAGADLLVMGGYGHSRLRELLIGGATRHVRSHATVPVLMSH